MAVNHTTRPNINDPFSSANDLQYNYQQSARDDEDADHILWNGQQQEEQQPQQQNQINKSNNNNNQHNNEQNQPAEQSWYQRMVGKFGSLELDNKGSVARDHLALERTFLAWLRTSLSFASIGIAVTQLFRLNSTISCDGGNSSSSSSFSSPSSSNLLEVLLAPPSLSSSNTNSNNTTRLRNIGKPLGATFVGIAILILIIGFHRYFESQYWIVRGKFPASRGSVALVSFVAAGLVIASFVVILAVAPNAMEL